MPHELAAIESARYLLAFANPRPHKGLADLLRAFERLAAEHHELHLVLVGKDAGGLVESTIRDSDARSRVVVSGFVEDSVLRALYRDAEAFVFPSYSEGFGLPLLEAMGMGAPVVTTTAASIPEVVGDTALKLQAGDVDALADTLKTLLGDAGLRERMSARARERAARFTWRRAAEQTAEVYGATIGRHKS